MNRKIFILFIFVIFTHDVYAENNNYDDKNILKILKISKNKINSILNREKINISVTDIFTSKNKNYLFIYNRFKNTAVIVGCNKYRKIIDLKNGCDNLPQEIFGLCIGSNRQLAHMSNGKYYFDITKIDQTGNFYVNKSDDGKIELINTIDQSVLITISGFYYANIRVYSDDNKLLIVGKSLDNQNDKLVYNLYEYTNNNFVLNKSGFISKSINSKRPISVLDVAISNGEILYFEGYDFPSLKNSKWRVYNIYTGMANDIDSIDNYGIFLKCNIDDMF